jgi:hypothetical protein
VCSPLRVRVRIIGLVLVLSVRASSDALLLIHFADASRNTLSPPAKAPSNPHVPSRQSVLLTRVLFSCRPGIAHSDVCQLFFLDLEPVPELHWCSRFLAYPTPLRPLHLRSRSRSRPRHWGLRSARRTSRRWTSLSPRSAPPPQHRHRYRHRHRHCVDGWRAGITSFSHRHSHSHSRSRSHHESRRRPKWQQRRRANSAPQQCGWDWYCRGRSHRLSLPVLPAHDLPL